MSDLGTTPLRQSLHDAINRYEAQIAGISDCFDSFTADAIRHEAEVIADSSNSQLAAAAYMAIRGHFDMLSTWYGAIDQLDSEIRGDVVEGGIAAEAQQHLKQEARALFGAQQILLRAIAEYYHGAAGPLLDPAYGYAYELSNSALSPF
ncbi:hypothetical protein OG455_41525 [Kitasatospora sp. NBC_01287]|uniref:hypothetical protein n=1 Tax=Kitasatospora sp. NBC_01287 TaxID=2903573 RepID=UPI0022510035|nr:hypothetical protein [Kitasatospora sp. NBC_01287]MCX4750965.1 hypothetical protein [Kitasatospora sp. NBC_01287]MCX4751784.1 hypothetical protein [Kitasatospora sp. NBC_01287]MCX4751924.1 hypothetical protein [Kitasatospora sp. NBC_01287]